MSLLSVFSTGHGDIVTENIADLFLVPVACAFYVLQKILNLSMNNVIYYFHFDGNYYAGDHIDIHDNTSVNFYQGENAKDTNTHETCVEDVTPVDTSFFCTNRFTSDIIEKNLRQAIESASSKADACRRVMDLEPLGYVVLSNVTDERKAELINPFASPKFILCGDDFTKARNRRTKQ